MEIGYANLSDIQINLTKNEEALKIISCPLSP
jgi:hypothetical protein